jgi:hydrogenase nickel incorporation protein HypA/HybF
MHEASLAQRILRQVEQIESDHPGMAALAVQVEVGPLSGVEPILLVSAFTQIVQESPRRELALTVCEVALTITCQSCHTDSDLENFQFVCPRCGSQQVRVSRGDGVQLLHVDLQEVD